MDALTLEIIVSFASFDDRQTIYESLAGYISPEDEENIFTDLSKISSHLILEYLASINRASRRQFAAIIASAMKHKIFIEGCTIAKLYKKYDFKHRTMIKAMSRDRMAWLRANPFSYDVGKVYPIDEIVKNTRIELIPYHGRVHNFMYVYRMQIHPFEDILRAFVNAGAVLGQLPLEYLHGNVSDDILKLYCKALQKGIMVPVRDSRLSRRLILATNHTIHDSLSINNEPPIESYVLAHIPEGTPLEEAPAELIAKAFLMRRRLRFFDETISH